MDEHEVDESIPEVPVIDEAIIDSLYKKSEDSDDAFREDEKNQLENDHQYYNLSKSELKRMKKQYQTKTRCNKTISDNIRKMRHEVEKKSRKINRNKK